MGLGRPAESRKVLLKHNGDTNRTHSNSRADDPLHQVRSIFMHVGPQFRELDVHLVLDRQLGAELRSPENLGDRSAEMKI